MVRFPFKERHSMMARNFYLVRGRLLDPFMNLSHAVVAMEKRVVEHLTHLARLGETSFSPNGRDEERFVFYATALQSSGQSALHDIYRLALKQMADDKLSDLPIHHAFSLFPPPLALLLELYQDLPGVRATLFAIWRRLRTELPDNLVNRAKEQRKDLALRRQALAYAADHPAYDVACFRAYYEPLLKPASGTPVGESLLEPAIWGGLVRDDPDAPAALRQAVERLDASPTRHRLMRLMALNGAADDLPLLLAACEGSSSFDPRWLALTGLQGAAAALIEQLGRAVTAKRANDAWLLLSGEGLPLQPALKLVGKRGEPIASPIEREERQPMIADSDFAQRIWESQRERWGAQRWVMGRSDDPVWLRKLCRDYAGAISIDLMDLLNLKHKQPLGRWFQDGWRTHQLRQLESSIQGLEQPHGSNENAPQAGDQPDFSHKR
jgi:hypothetical protein